MAKKLSPLLAARVHFGLLRADSPLPLAPIPRRITSPPPATVVHHWPLPLPRNELRAPKRMKPCPHPISRTLLFSPLSSCLEDAEDSTRSQRSSGNLNSRCFETISPLFFSLSARENSSPEEKRNESKGMVGKGRMYANERGANRCIPRAIVTRTATTEKKECGKSGGGKP